VRAAAALSVLLAAAGSAYAPPSSSAALPLILPPVTVKYSPTALLQDADLHEQAHLHSQDPHFNPPLQVSYRISSPFGRRTHPIAGRRHTHTGADLAAPRGTDVLAIAEGTVHRIVQTPGGYGRLVVIAHDAGYSSWYAHLERFAPTLAVGHRVQQGTLLGQVGSSGSATGPHLHLEIRQHNAPMEPMALLQPLPDPASPGASGWGMRASPP